MLTGLLQNAPSTRKFTDVFAAFKKIIPSSVMETSDAQLQKELERLALSAPHMLADIGFARDSQACSSEQEVWRRGTHCVIICSSKRAAAFN